MTDALTALAHNARKQLDTAGALAVARQLLRDRLMVGAETSEARAQIAGLERRMDGLERTAQVIEAEIAAEHRAAVDAHVTAETARIEAELDAQLDAMAPPPKPTRPGDSR